MQRLDKQKIISISKQECFELSEELEAMFCRADCETEQGNYSFRNIQEKYPKICALYFAVSEP